MLTRLARCIYRAKQRYHLTVYIPSETKQVGDRLGLCRRSRIVFSQFVRWSCRRSARSSEQRFQFYNISSTDVQQVYDAGELCRLRDFCGTIPGWVFPDVMCVGPLAPIRWLIPHMVMLSAHPKSCFCFSCSQPWILHHVFVCLRKNEVGYSVQQVKTKLFVCPSSANSRESIWRPLWFHSTCAVSRSNP